VKRLRILGWAVLIIVAVAFAIDFAIKSSSRASPANSVSLRQSFLGLYQGDLGFWLTGDSVSTPVTDWSFTDAAQTVLVETRTWYLILTLYVPSLPEMTRGCICFRNISLQHLGSQISGTVSLKRGSGIGW
jgi:hypothetical protein